MKISHKKDGHRRRQHKFHVSPPLPGHWIRYCIWPVLPENYMDVDSTCDRKTDGLQDEISPDIKKFAWNGKGDK